ncbi:keratin, type I cytoskeletal 42 [Oryzias melastigma]|uniref:Keratin 99 n=1 Tax=Oryzias melastigma TaxID=30732 RepID=A0A3B3DFA9_ORYME|nr:keratin, type I cytoskeletal 42 [Oryzias melastigma]
MSTTLQSSVFRASSSHGWMLAPSVHGKAGISQSTSAGMWWSGGHEDALTHCSEKLTMQNLNQRLSRYLEKVRSLEEKNGKLELKIREFCLKKKAVPHDFRKYLETISDLRAQISRRWSKNQSVAILMDNLSLAADDFRMKYEVELGLRNAVDADILRLRNVRDSLTLRVSDLEMTVETLREELMSLKKNHSEEMHQLQVGPTGEVNVEVDAADSVDLTEVLEEVRVSYEAVLRKNKLELETWYQSKMESLQKEIVSCTTEVKTFQTELTELRRTHQNLEIKRQSVCAEVQLLRENLEEVNLLCGVRLSQRQETVHTLEMELQELRVSLQQSQGRYSVLLELRTKLEAEIAEYRRLLGGEHQEKKRDVIICVVTEEVEEPKQHVEKRVRTIVEEIIDGQVVSSSEKTQVQTIQ